MTLPEALRAPEEDFWLRPTLEMARALLGCVLVRDLGQQQLAGRIVETEAYLQDDPASHSFGGRSRRNAAMFGPPGRAYVYFTYGNHFCLNVVTAADGMGEAVLIRAMEPLAGMEEMAARRVRSSPRELLSGPGKICQAMGIDRSLDGHPLDAEPLRLFTDRWDTGEICEAKRVGIFRAADRCWRFYPLRSGAWVSRR